MSYSKLILTGNLGNTPELRYTKDETAVTNFSVAVNRKRNGDKITTWYRVSVFGVNAENSVQYLKKGSKVLVEGSDLRVNPYTNKDGQPAASLELTAERIVFLDTAPTGDEPSDEAQDIPF